MALAEIIPDGLESAANCNSPLTKPLEKTRQTKAREGHTWQTDDKGLGGMWNKLNGGYPTPELTEVHRFIYSYQTLQAISQTLKNAGIDFDFERNDKGMYLVMVAKKFAHKAQRILN